MHIKCRVGRRKFPRAQLFTLHGLDFLSLFRLVRKKKKRERKRKKERDNPSGFSGAHRVRRLCGTAILVCGYALNATEKRREGREEDVCVPTMLPGRCLNTGFNLHRARGSATVGGNRARAGPTTSRNNKKAATHAHTGGGCKRRVGDEGSRVRAALRIISVISSFLGRGRCGGKTKRWLEGS